MTEAILAFVQDNPGCMTGAIADHIGISRKATSMRVARLGEEGRLTVDRDRFTGKFRIYPAGHGIPTTRAGDEEIRAAVMANEGLTMAELLRALGRNSHTSLKERMARMNPPIVTVFVGNRQGGRICFSSEAERDRAQPVPVVIREPVPAAGPAINPKNVKPTIIPTPPARFAVDSYTPHFGRTCGIHGKITLGINPETGQPW